jgi:GT2 family glycosyltransferase
MEPAVQSQLGTSKAQPNSPSSLIICTRNRYKLLCDTIASILEADDVPSELIIVDQSDVAQLSLDGLPNQRGCDVRYLWLQEVGSSHARNKGSQVAKHDILVFIDDDMWVDRQWYGNLIRPLVNVGTRGVVTGKVDSAPPEGSNGFVIALHTWQEPSIYEGRIGKDVLASGHMAMYRSVYEALGGFDERLGPGTHFPGAEDNDFGFRLLEAGYQILYVPDSVIYHRAWRKREDYVRLFWNYGKGQGAFYAKHLRLRDRYMLRRAKQDFARFVRLLPQRLLKRQLLVLGGSTAFIFGQLSGAVEWVLTRKRI